MFLNFLFPFRLSSIDMKYHIWKLGVVFTDNVSIASGETRFYAPGSGMSLDCTRKKLGRMCRKIEGLMMLGHVSLVQSCKTDGVPLGNS